jgi:hypothetical protein
MGKNLKKYFLTKNKLFIKMSYKQLNKSPKKLV